MPTRRKALIAIGGSVAIAGCSTSDFSGENGDSDPAGSPSESEEGTNGSENDSDEDPATNETEESEQQEEELTQEELFQEALDDVEEQYLLAFEEFGKATDHDDATFMHVLPSTEIGNDEVNAAREYTNSGSDLSWDEARAIAETDEQRDREREYRQYGDVILGMGRVQREIHRTFVVLDPPEDGTNYDLDQFDEAVRRYENVDEEIDDFEMYIDEIQIKHDQLEWQLEQLERTLDGLSSLQGALNPSILSADQLRFARDEFEAVRDELEDPESAPPEDIIDEEYAELMDEWYEATEETLRELLT